MDEEIVECSVCGEKFDVECEGIEIDDDCFCPDCAIDETFFCPVCGDSELEENKDSIGSVMIVNDAREAGIARGVWEIIEHPYWLGSCLGMDRFFKSALKYLGPLRKDQEIDTNGHACGHVCRYCNPKIKNMATTNRWQQKPEAK